MYVILIFLAAVVGSLVVWLLSQTVRQQPWVAESGPSETSGSLPSGFTAERVGLVVFLAVVASLFALSISAYQMRMDFAEDWQPLPEPGLLWFNTVMLLLGSVGLQWAWNAARREQAQMLTWALLAGGACTLVFIGGQYVVWQDLVAAGYYVDSNPANAFFYMITALHALHMAGGLVAWGRTARRHWQGAEPARLIASLELCAVYWHFLLMVWVVLFWLLLTT